MLRLGYLHAQQSSDTWTVDSFTQFKLAVHHVNANKTVLPGVNLSFEEFDTNRSQLAAATGASMFARAGMAGLVVTDVASALTGAALVCSIHRLPIISPTSTSPRFVDKAEFPYLLRSAPVSVDVPAMVEYVRAFGWQHVGVVAQVGEVGSVSQRHSNLVSCTPTRRAVACAAGTSAAIRDSGGFSRR